MLFYTLVDVFDFQFYLIEIFILNKPSMFDTLLLKIEFKFIKVGKYNYFF